MRLRTLVAIGLGAIGLIAVGNRVTSMRVAPLNPALPGTEQVYRWRGMDIAYVDAGDPDRQDVVLLHGISAAGSSQEFERIFDDLVEEYHVIVPDLPGFGRSDRPPLVYSASFYESFVTDFLRDIGTDPVCIASSLTAAYAVASANRSDVSQLILICPTGTTVDRPRPFIRTLIRSPLIGTGIYNVLASKPSIRYFSTDHSFYSPDEVDPKDVEYLWQTAHQPGARFAPASFVSGHLDVNFDLAEELADLDVPITLVWGREADILPLDEGRRLAEEGNTKLIVIDRSRLLPHAEHPETVVNIIREEIQRVPS